MIDVRNNIKKKIGHYVLPFSIAFWVFSWIFWHYLDANLWYLGTAQLILCLSVYIHDDCKNKWGRFISSLFVFLAFNQFIDELLFDPLKVEWNEFVTFAIFIIYTIWKVLKK